MSASPLARDDRRLSTLMGVGAIVVWSANIGVSRSAAESVGAITSATAMFLVAGAVGCVYAGVVQRRLSAMLALPRPYLLGGGALFATYTVCLFLAVGLSASRQQTIEVAVLNYLWPSVTLVLAVPILKRKVTWAFPMGVVVALAGAGMAPLQLDRWSLAGLTSSLSDHPAPYALAAAAAVLWGLYSTLSRRWAAQADQGAVPLFSLATGLALLLIRLLFPEPADWSWRTVAELLFLALLPGLMGYVLWDRAMRRGNVTLVASLSYAIPVLSTVVSCWYLDVPVPWNVWVGCVLVVAGAVVANRSRTGRSAPPTARPRRSTHRRADRSRRE